MEEWEALQARCMGCTRCELAATRTNLVFGVGNPHAEVLFIGEGPGEQEDLRGEPFVGRSGKLLDQYLAAIDLDRKKNIYIANMVKCRPPGNRDPKPEEQEECMVWLKEQVRLMRPKIIVCLGRIAAQRILRTDFKVTQEHGRFAEHNGIWRMGTYHPAMLLRDPRKKEAALQDFLALRAKLNELSAHSPP
ncbi:MAG: uracil-DNA glycosylase [Oscillospiraceae bacterium]|jgi:DNA polymerase|nr:uracil-DNA glycosylase [Oscillospiraceae bacterium]